MPSPSAAAPSSPWPSTWPTAGPSEALRFKQVVPHECEQAIENLVSLTINFSNDAMRMSWLLRTIRCGLECVYLIDGPALSKHHCVEDTAALNFITGCLRTTVPHAGRNRVLTTAALEIGRASCRERVL